MDNVKKAGNILTAWFNEQYDSETLETARISAELFSTSWAAVAKDVQIPSASDHCRIRELERGILVIEAEHPGWVQILQTKQTLLLKAFQKKFPELKIQGLSFYLSRELISKPMPGKDTNQRTTKKKSSAGQGSGESIRGRPESGSVPADLSDEPQESSMDKSTYETLNKFKKIIQKRNSENSV